MAIYAISDLHLSFGTNKPMDVFGDEWINHPWILKENWLKIVKKNDYVLIPGDVSWGINLEEAEPDFAFIESLPGRKIISKGNHDYWWSTLNKLNNFLEAKDYKSINFLHNNSFMADDYAVCGTRGWKSKDDEDFDSSDEKIFNRELARLKLSLTEGRKKSQKLIAMLHYPPFDSKHKLNDFGQILKDFGVEICIYGHIHGKANEAWKAEYIDGIRFHLVSCNIIDFMPIDLSSDLN
ncbi:MAG: serine/threonine protein phosphatase [Clostridiaceae bacterium]|nr:serine/threonine protein phosphatase [Clostridiaceae bacterium]